MDYKQEELPILFPYDEHQRQVSDAWYVGYAWGAGSVVTLGFLLLYVYPWIIGQF